jgi:hypothetical protein
MEFIVGAISDVVDGISLAQINTIMNEFWAVGNTIQVANNQGDIVQCSAFSATNDIIPLVPLTMGGKGFVGVLVKEVASSPNPNWHRSNQQRATFFFDGDMPYLGYPCTVFVEVYPPIEDVLLPGIVLGMRYEYDRSVPKFTLQTGIPQVPTFSNPQNVFDMPCFMEYNNAGNAGIVCIGGDMYYKKIGNAYYFCSENFTGSTHLEASTGTKIGAIDLQF